MHMHMHMLVYAYVYVYVFIYICICIKIDQVELVNKEGERFDIMTENLTNAVNVSIYHKYIHTPITTNAQTIKEAVSRGHYIDNECWIDLLTDFMLIQS